MSTPAISPIGSLPNVTQATPPVSSGTPGGTPGGTAGLANENTFLKLLVAQLKNQDPLNPQDGTQFVAQLAQFSGLEQSIQMRQDLDAIKVALKSPTAPAADPTVSKTSQP